MNNITPQLFVDRQKVKENIDKMVSKAKKKGVRFRPHFKTHQSAHIGEWFKDAGVSSITVSTIKMANYFAKNGWNDITVALPVNILEIEQINELSKKIQLNLTVTNKESIEFLKKELNGEVNIYIKVDTGNKRTGIAIENEKEMDEVVEALKGDHKLNFKGLMIHSGHTYYASSTYEIDIIHRQSVDQLKQLRKRYMSYFEDIELSVGDTPSCSISTKFKAVDEIRPGNFVFYDIMQKDIGSCSVDDIAIVLSCPVLAVHKNRKDIIIYGGAVHLSADHSRFNNRTPYYGLVVDINENGWGKPIEKTYVRKLSQDLGIIHTLDENFLKRIKPGHKLGVLPVHSCLSADNMNYYYTIEGEKLEKMNEK